MARNSSWKGYLKISLVSLPVKAYSASVSNDGQLGLHQLHAECHSRIQYKKTCPIHGVVSNDEIVSGYEYAKGKYVVIDPDELDKLRTENDRSINVTTFVDAEQIDPVYHAGKDYYLVPDGPIGQKPYHLIHQAMKAGNVTGLAQVVISRKEELVMVRPVDKLLVMTVLKYASEIKEPESFVDELVDSKGSKQEVQLTTQLIEALTVDRFDPSEFHDVYTEKLTQLIEAKVAGKEVVAPPETEQPDVINLMDAIKQSMKQIKPYKSTAKPARKTAAGKSTHPTARRRKSG